MATQLFLRDTQNNGISNYRDMVATAGSSVQTNAQAPTTAGGTEIQYSDVGAGTDLFAWISGRSPAGGWTLQGGVSVSVWQSESGMNANAGGRVRVFKRTAAGVETELSGSPADDGVEMSTSAREDIWVASISGVSFAEDDRLLVKFYATNVGTMGGGFTCTLTYNAASGSTGDSFIQLVENVTFKAEGGPTTHQGEAALAVSGAVAASASVRYAGESAVQAIGSITPTGGLRLNADSSLPAVGSLAGSASIFKRGEASLLGSADVGPNARATYRAGASLLASGVLSDSGTTVYIFATSTLMGSGVLAGASGIRYQADASVLGSAALTPAGRLLLFGISALPGVVTLAADGTVTPAGGAQQGEAALSANAVVDGAARVLANAAAALDGAGQLSSSGALRLSAMGAVSGTGAVSGAPKLTVRNTVLLEASVTVVGDGNIIGRVQGAASLLSGATVAVQGRLLQFGGAGLLGSALLQIAPSLRLPSNALLSGSAQLMSSGLIRANAASSMDAVASLLGAARLTLHSGVALVATVVMTADGSFKVLLTPFPLPALHDDVVELQAVHTPVISLPAKHEGTV